MKLTITAAILSAGAALASLTAAAHSSPVNQLPCIAKVVRYEELPYAPINSWLVKVTLEITPPNGNAYQTTLENWMPWQGPPPRRGQAFRVLCDPANPSDLHHISRSVTRTSF